MSNDPLLQIKEDIGFIRGTVESIKKQNADQFDLLYKHQVNLNELNLWKEGMTGKITVITAIIGGVWALVLTFGKVILDKLLK